MIVYSFKELQCQFVADHFIRHGYQSSHLNGQKMLVCKWFGFQMGPVNWNPTNPKDPTNLKDEQNDRYLVFAT